MALLIKDAKTILALLKDSGGFYSHQGNNLGPSKYYEPPDGKEDPIVSAYWQEAGCPDGKDPCTLFFPIANIQEERFGDIFNSSYAIKCQSCGEINQPAKFLPQNKNKRNDLICPHCFQTGHFVLFIPAAIPKNK